MQRVRHTILLISLLAVPHTAQILHNGGFEQELSHWTTATTSGSAATFAVQAAKVHSGSAALQVAVNNPGSSAHAVMVTGDIFQAQVNRLYMLRFWALSSRRDAVMDINLRGENRDSRCHFQIYDSLGPGWQMYQYCFNADESELRLELSFGTAATYLVDDIELVEQGDPVIDVATQYMWQTFLSGWGFVSGDNDVSVPLPDGRIAWILNDSFLGTPDDHSNVLKESTMINNLIVVQEGFMNRQLRSIYGGSQSSPRSLFPCATPGAFYWICDGFVEDGSLKVLLQEWTHAAFNRKAAVATLSLPGLTVESIVNTPFNGSDIPYSILVDDDYTYIYTVERVATFEIYSRVARVPRGRLDGFTPWEYYAASGEWTNDPATAGRIIAGIEAASVIKLGPGNYVLSGVSHLSHELVVWFAPSPVGPWTDKSLVYAIPREEGVLPYMGHIHKGTERDGVYTLSYSLYPFGGGVPQQLSDKTVYIPGYVFADLKKLSPYSPVPCAGRSAYPIEQVNPWCVRSILSQPDAAPGTEDRCFGLTGRAVRPAAPGGRNPRTGVWVTRQAQPE